MLQQTPKGARFGEINVEFEHRGDGAMIVRPARPLPPYPTRMMDSLHRWAALRPDAVFLAERNPQGAWRKVVYADALNTARHIASALIARDLNADRPLLILSGNSIDHALLALGAMYAGVPYCPVSPPYSLMSGDFGKLTYIMATLTPGLVYAQDGAAFSKALQHIVPPGIEIAISTGAVPGREATSFEALCQTPEHAEIDACFDAVGPDSVAKFLLTSGSTAMPKVVINTHRMLCANQVMIRETFLSLKDAPPILLDWLPWNHTFGGNHNFGLALFNGGSLYIDEGRPAPGGMAASVRNLLEVSPTIYFNVPKGYEMLVPFLQADAGLRANFFARLKMMFFAGASLPAHIWAAIDALAIQETGARVPMLTGLGSTETAPFSLSASPQTSRSGHVGLPVTGNEIKLVPNGRKLEVRVRGPNVTPGYWRQPEQTAKAFDEEGFYKLGDALKPVDPHNLAAGFDFDGRISEDFKLASGTWVSVGPMRAKLIAACAPLVRDVALAGINEDEVSALVILDMDGCRNALPHLAGMDLAQMTEDAALRNRFCEGFSALAEAATGSASRIMRAVLLPDHLSIDRGEVTDKGSINQNAVVETRAALVKDLYSPNPPAHVLHAKLGTTQ